MLLAGSLGGLVVVILSRIAMLLGLYLVVMSISAGSLGGIIGMVLSRRAMFTLLIVELS